MLRASRVLAVLAFVIFSIGYPASYVALRASHFFVHAAYFISEEGLNAHYDHEMEGHDDRQRFFTPLISAELWWWRHWKP